jgi:hypothetical protein
MKFLLDYVFPISVINPIPAASTAFLKQACVVAKPKSGQEGNVGNIYECINMSDVGLRTDNTEAQQLFDAGMARVFVLLADDLDLTDFLSEGKGSDFWTLLISSDFDDTDISTVIDTPAVAASKTFQSILTFTAKTAGTGGNSITINMTDTATAGSEIAHASGNAITISMEDGVSTAAQIKAAVEESVSSSALVSVSITSGQETTAINQSGGAQNLTGGAAAITSAGTGIQVGTWDGIIGYSSTDQDVCEDQAIITNRVCFFTSSTNKAKNMFYAFGSLLSNRSGWLNQQYITMPLNDGIETLGQAESLFDSKVSFVISDDEFGNRLALFAAGEKAVVEPYILKNLRVDLQSAGLSWISANQPSYTKKEAALLETRLQEDVINAKYIALNWIEAGIVQITLVESNFVANGSINVAEPKALWRVFNEMRQTL